MFAFHMFHMFHNKVNAALASHSLEKMRQSVHSRIGCWCLLLCLNVFSHSLEGATVPEPACLADGGLSLAGEGRGPSQIINCMDSVTIPGCYFKVSSFGLCLFFLFDLLAFAPKWEDHMVG